MVEFQGMLRVFILSALAEKPASGKSLIGEVIKTTGGKWKPSFGTIYPLLKKLEEQKLIKSSVKHGNHGEIVYELTKKGASSLDEEKQGLLKKMHEAMGVAMPLIMRTLYCWDEKQLAEFRVEHEEFLRFREKLLSMPHKKRCAITSELFEKMRRLR